MLKTRLIPCLDVKDAQNFAMSLARAVRRVQDAKKESGHQ